MRKLISLTSTQKKWWAVTLGAIVFLLVAYLPIIPSHAAGGIADPYLCGVAHPCDMANPEPCSLVNPCIEPIQGVVNDNPPSTADGVGDLSDTDIFTGAIAFAASQDADGAVSGVSSGDNYTDKDPHPPLIRVRTHYQVWTRDVLLTEPLAGHTEAHIQATITTEYYFWHGFVGQGNRVAVFGVDLCYAFKGGLAPGILWGGISADAQWFDNTNATQVTDLRTGDKGKGGCIHERVPVEHREWLVMTQHPSWEAQGWINWKLDGDQSFHWHGPHIDDSRWLSPAKDPVITTKTGKVWHNIYKTW